MGPMGSMRRGHSATDHGEEATKKQLFRVEGEAVVRSIRNDADWYHVHRQGFDLRCPIAGCPQRLIAKLSNRGRRFIANKRGSRCGHAAPQGGGGEMTEEHLWLQNEIRERCMALGYEAQLEVSGDGNRVDVLVDSGDLFAVEVQRGDTDFTERRRQREAEGRRMVWVIPGTASPATTSAHKRGSNPIFSEPCVRLGYADRREGRAQWIPDEQLRSTVWNGGGGAVHLKAWATVGAFDKEHCRFASRALDFDVFLHEVLSGRRRWDPRALVAGDGGTAWAGWLIDAEVDEFDAAKRDERERVRRVRDAVRRAAALSVVKESERVEVDLPPHAVLSGPIAGGLVARPAVEAEGRVQARHSAPTGIASDRVSQAGEAESVGSGSGRVESVPEQRPEQKKTFLQRLKAFWKL